MGGVSCPRRRFCIGIARVDQEFRRDAMIAHPKGTKIYKAKEAHDYRTPLCLSSDLDYFLILYIANDLAGMFTSRDVPSTVIGLV